MNYNKVHHKIKKYTLKLNNAKNDKDADIYQQKLNSYRKMQSGGGLVDNIKATVRDAKTVLASKQPTTTTVNAPTIDPTPTNLTQFAAKINKAKTQYKEAVDGLMESAVLVKQLKRAIDNHDAGTTTTVVRTGYAYDKTEVDGHVTDINNALTDMNFDENEFKAAMNVVDGYEDYFNEINTINDREFNTMTKTVPVLATTIDSGKSIGDIINIDPYKNAVIKKPSNLFILAALNS